MKPERALNRVTLNEQTIKERYKNHVRTMYRTCSNHVRPMYHIRIMKESSVDIAILELCLFLYLIFRQAHLNHA